MGSDWTYSQLGDLVSIKGGKRLPKGEALSEQPNDHPYIRVRDLTGGRIDAEGLLYVPDEVFEKISRYTVDQGDIIMTIVGTVGLVAENPRSLHKASLTENAAKLIVSEPEKLQSAYLRWYLSSTLGQNEVSINTVGSTQPKLPIYGIANIAIPLPPLPEQKAIAHILGTLDDKIELNRRMNATLEGMAQALFKSWFVDFDPVIDNAIEAGNPIPDELADRAEVRRQALANGTANREAAKPFPAAFAFTEEMGWIPEGWEVNQLGEITTEIRRGISPKYTDEQGVRVLNQRCIRDHKISYANARRNDTMKRKVDGRLLRAGDVLINSTGVGTLGRIAQIQSLEEPTAVDSHVTVARPDQSQYMPFTFGRMMTSLEPQIEAMGHGSTGQTELSRADLAVMPVIVPSKPTQKLAENLLSEWASKVAHSSIQSDALRKQRDALLPRLISGKLRVSGSEERIKEEVS